VLAVHNPRKKLYTSHSYTIDHLAKNIEPAEPNQHTQTMAAAHDLLRQKQRSQKTNRHQIAQLLPDLSWLEIIERSQVETAFAYQIISNHRLK